MGDRSPKDKQKHQKQHENQTKQKQQHKQENMNKNREHHAPDGQTSSDQNPHQGHKKAG